VTTLYTGFECKACGQRYRGGYAVPRGADIEKETLAFVARCDGAAAAHAAAHCEAGKAAHWSGDKILKLPLEVRP